MIAALIALTAMLAALLVFSAVRKLSHTPAVVAEYARTDVPEHWLTPLAILLLAATGGVLVGLIWAPIGIAAAAGLVGYFAVAIGFHVKSGDTADIRNPIVIALFAAFVLALQILR